MTVFTAITGLQTWVLGDVRGRLAFRLHSNIRMPYNLLFPLFGI